MPVVFLGPGFPRWTGFFGIFLGQNRAQRRCGGHALRQCTALLPGSMALQTENTVGLPLARKERICGEIVINVLIFFGVLLVFQGPIQALQNAPPHSKMKKKEKQTGKPRLNLTRSLQQGNSR